MDDTDFKIVYALKENSRITASELSKKVNMSIPAVTERIKKLEQSGVICKFTINIDYKKIGFRLLAYILLNIESSRHIQQFEKDILLFSEVTEVSRITGEYDFMIKIMVSDLIALDDFISCKLKGLDGVLKTNTLIILSNIK